MIIKEVIEWLTKMEKDQEREAQDQANLKVV